MRRRCCGSERDHGHAVHGRGDGSEGANFQFTNPFSQVQFYYFDTVTERVHPDRYGHRAGRDGQPGRDGSARSRTRSTRRSTRRRRSAGGRSTPQRVIAVGVNASGDALASRVNANITLTNP